MTLSPRDLSWELLKFQAWGIGSEGIEGPGSLTEYKSPEDPNVTAWQKLTRRQLRDHAFSSNRNWLLSQLSPVARERQQRFKSQSQAAIDASRAHMDATKRHLSSLGSDTPDVDSPGYEPKTRIGPWDYPVHGKDMQDRPDRPALLDRTKDPRLQLLMPAKTAEGEIARDDAGRPITDDIEETPTFARPIFGPEGSRAIASEKRAQKFVDRKYGTKGQNARREAEANLINDLADRRGYYTEDETKRLEQIFADRHALSGLSPRSQQKIANLLGLAPKKEKSDWDWDNLASEDQEALRNAGMNKLNWDKTPERMRGHFYDSVFGGDGVESESTEPTSSKAKEKGEAKGKAGTTFSEGDEPPAKGTGKHNHDYLDGGKEFTGKKSHGRKRKWRNITCNEAGQTNRDKYGVTAKALKRNLDRFWPGGYKGKLPKKGEMTGRNFLRKVLFKGKNNSYADRLHDTIQSHPESHMTIEGWLRGHKGDKKKKIRPWDGFHPDIKNGHFKKPSTSVRGKRRKTKKPAKTKTVRATKGKPATADGKCQRCGRNWHHGGKCSFGTNVDGKPMGANYTHSPTGKAAKKGECSYCGKGLSNPNASHHKRCRLDSEEKSKKPKEPKEPKEDPWANFDEDSIMESFDDVTAIGSAWGLLKSGR